MPDLRGTNEGEDEHSFQAKNRPSRSDGPGRLHFPADGGRYKHELSETQAGDVVRLTVSRQGEKALVDVEVHLGEPGTKTRMAEKGLRIAECVREIRRGNCPQIKEDLLLATIFATISSLMTTGHDDRTIYIGRCWVRFHCVRGAGGGRRGGGWTWPPPMNGGVDHRPSSSHKKEPAGGCCEMDYTRPHRVDSGALPMKAWQTRASLTPGGLCAGVPGSFTCTRLGTLDAADDPFSYILMEFVEGHGPLPRPKVVLARAGANSRAIQRRGLGAEGFSFCGMPRPAPGHALHRGPSAKTDSLSNSNTWPELLFGTFFHPIWGARWTKITNQCNAVKVPQGCAKKSHDRLDRLVLTAIVATGSLGGHLGDHSV